MQNNQANQSLYSQIRAQMDKLDTGEITVDVAKGQASLAKQANNCLRYELDKTALLLKIEQANSEIKLSEVQEIP